MLSEKKSSGFDLAVHRNHAPLGTASQDHSAIGLTNLHELQLFKRRDHGAPGAVGLFRPAQQR